MFATAASQTFVARGRADGLAASAFVISFLWYGNARRAARDGRPLARECYAAGAAAGAVCGFFSASAISRFLQ